ncbi:ParB/RepB/Spo0J family partition protein [Kitasatospora kazusensis]|uniref:ParB/RepB/Spo0J family partition protein n=1 Tax=Kitasatospora kazusensis TaxID=407974 RepID=A0ABN3A546_9ACTN
MASTKRRSLADLVGGNVKDSAADGQATSPQMDGDVPAVRIKTDRLLANPHNPRDDIGDLEDLRSIAERQLQSCLVVTKAAYLRLWPDEADALRGTDYVVVNGCRRHAAAVRFGRHELICIVDDGVAESRAKLLRTALDENTERRDFDPIEEARAVESVVGEYPSAAAAAGAEGWTTNWVSQRRRLLLLAPEVQKSVRERARGGEGMALRDARWLCGRPNLDQMNAEQQFAAVHEMRSSQRETAASNKVQGQRKAAAAPKDKQDRAQVPAYTAVYAGAGAPGDDSVAPAEPAEPYTAVYETGGSSAPADERPVPEQRERSHERGAHSVDWQDIPAFATAIRTVLGKEKISELAEALINGL